MKKYISAIFLLTLTAFLATVWSYKRIQPTEIHAPTNPQGARPKESSPAKSRSEASGSTVTRRAVGRPRVNFSIYIDLKKVAKELHLTERQAADLEELLSASREAVVRTLAQHGKFEQLDERSAKWTVILPHDLAESQRQAFYGKLESIIGPGRMNDLTTVVNVAKFEAALEFFGVFPAIYEFEVSQGTLARADFVEARTTVVRKDSYGGYNSFWAEKLIMEDFRAKFGPLAERAVSRD